MPNMQHLVAVSPYYSILLHGVSTKHERASGANRHNRRPTNSFAVRRSALAIQRSVFWGHPVQILKRRQPMAAVLSIGRHWGREALG